MSSLSVFVQCPKALRPGFERCRASIEESDIGKNYEVVLQEPGVGLIEHFVGLLRRMGRAKTELALRLEDDVIVNRFIVHNLTTWPAVHQARFLIGWAFDPGGRGFTVHDRIYQRAASSERWIDCEDVLYSQAILLRTCDAADVADACEKFWKIRPDLPGAYQDLALSNVPRILGRGAVVIHAPSLTEHLIELPSQLEHRHDLHATSMGTFVADWKRPT